MTVGAILFPVFAYVALVFGLGVLMGRRRLAVVRGLGVRREDVILGQRAWPEKAQAASNAFSNQFEVPVLFLALVPLAIATRKADLIFVVMSWLFVASRYVHAIAYVTTNALPYRFTSFLVGVVLLLAMWAVFAVRILAAPVAA